MWGGGGLTWVDLKAWARMSDRRVRHHECLALLELDSVIRNANKKKDKKPDEEDGGDE